MSEKYELSKATAFAGVDKPKLAEWLEGIEEDELNNGLSVVNTIRGLIKAEKDKRDLAEKTQANEEWNEHCKEPLSALKKAEKCHYYYLDWASETIPARGWGTKCDQVDEWNGGSEVVLSKMDLEGTHHYLANEEDHVELPLDENDEITIEKILEHTEKLYEEALDNLAKFPKEGHKRYNLKLSGRPEIQRVEHKLYESCSRYGDEPSRLRNCICCGQRKLYLSYIDRGGQEMPGAPVYPDVEYWTCFSCGWKEKGNVEYTTGGVDLAGQPLYAGMSTREVAEICVCNDPEYGPNECMNPECRRDYY
tara:strand:+ start:9010 stop:9930 length:921 start_codon:yes stop_codon:yes gene_type:complete